MSEHSLTLGQCAALASIIEATAPKPGNVHRGADFEDAAYPDFLVSSAAIAPIFDRADSLSVGQLVLESVAATQRLVGTNTNLGMLLLFAPLAKVPRTLSLQAGIDAVLSGLTGDDARDVYAAIRLAKPGGIGSVEEADVSQPAPESLLHAMQLAAERDLIAYQYAHSFRQVLTSIVPWLKEGIGERDWPISDAVVHAFLHQLAAEPDSLIARKCGPAVAVEASRRAGKVLEWGVPGNPVYHEAMADFDFWLRSDHHRRNPGTTADLIAAGLFACLRDDLIKPPFRLAENLATEEDET